MRCTERSTGCRHDAQWGTRTITVSGSAHRSIHKLTAAPSSRQSSPSAPCLPASTIESDDRHTFGRLCVTNWCTLLPLHCWCPATTQAALQSRAPSRHVRHPSAPILACISSTMSQPPSSSPRTYTCTQGRANRRTVYEARCAATGRLEFGLQTVPLYRPARCGTSTCRRTAALHCCTSRETQTPSHSLSPCLWVGGPVGEFLQPLPHRLVRQDVKRAKRLPSLLQRLHNLAAEAAARRLGRALQITTKQKGREGGRLLAGKSTSRPAHVR